MSKFIELTVGGEKHLFNTDNFCEIEPLKSRCRVYQMTDMGVVRIAADESYEQVKAMLAGDTNVGYKDTDATNNPMQFEWKEVFEQYIELCDRCDCNCCKYRDIGDTSDACAIAFAVDYINKKMRGEYR